MKPGCAVLKSVQVNAVIDDEKESAAAASGVDLPRDYQPCRPIASAKRRKTVEINDPVERTLLEVENSVQGQPPFDLL